MKKLGSLLGLALALTAFHSAAGAEETNSYPQSHLETLEATTGLVLIRSTDELGFVAGKTGGVAVRCREVRDVGSGHCRYGAHLPHGFPSARW